MGLKSKNISELKKRVINSDLLHFDKLGLGCALSHVSSIHIKERTFSSGTVVMLYKTNRFFILQSVY